MSVSTEFAVWKTIKLGTGLKTADDFLTALESGGYRIVNWAEDILRAFRAADEETEVDLVRVTVAELGFEEGAYWWQDIIEKTLELGLQLCPPEVGPQLRLQYPDQPHGERIKIGMEPIPQPEDDPSIVFDVSHDDEGRELVGDSCSGYSCFWGANDLFVFVRPRPPASEESK